jgi:hypothetical protein
MQKDKSNIVVYNDGELELTISVNDETIWLSLVPNVHVGNAYKTK